MNTASTITTGDQSSIATSSTAGAINTPPSLSIEDTSNGKTTNGERERREEGERGGEKKNSSSESSRKLVFTRSIDVHSSPPPSNSSSPQILPSHSGSRPTNTSTTGGAGGMFQKWGKSIENLRDSVVKFAKNDS